MPETTAGTPPDIKPRSRVVTDGIEATTSYGSSPLVSGTMSTTSTVYAYTALYNYAERKIDEVYSESP